MDSSEIGRYGTISFMKRLEPNAVVAAFPIDEEEVTFGRDPNCSVRLYYKAVSLIHCKIIFEERKAFLEVLGVNGLIIDDCKVFPSPSPSRPTTIPLSNNSDIEIHNKRFRFTYPPKELRAALLATPSHPGSFHAPHSRRALRMSMIQSAQVFSPRPSKDPRENLRVLQSPLKPFKTSTKSKHQREYDSDVEEANQEDEIVLVDGNHPRVVEEEKDLIIFEDVEVKSRVEEIKTPTQPSYNTARTPGRKVTFTGPYNSSPRTPPPVPQADQQQSNLFQPQTQPQTPIRRFPTPSLHRAVLIRSAQRAVMQAEMEKENEEEEKEVEEFIATDVAVAERASEEEGSDQDGDEVGSEDKSATMGISTWKTKLHVAKMWPFSSATQAREGERDVIDVDETESLGEHDDDEQDLTHHDTIAAPTNGQYSAADTRLFGKFMTPQPKRVEGKGRGRKSYAGPSLDRVDADGGARRVLMVEKPWRVKDIVLPEKEVDCIKTEDEGETKDVLSQNGVIRGSGKRRERPSEEERKAIQERRRSALTTSDTFFGGQAPGIRNLAALPGSPARAAGSTSPIKPGAASFGKADMKSRDEKVEDEALDTKSLLEKMKDTVEVMKRRRSMNPRASMSGSRMSLGLGMSPRKALTPGDESEEFSLLAPGVKEELALSIQGQAELNGAQDNTMDLDDDNENTTNNLLQTVFNGEDEPTASDENIGIPVEPRTPTRPPARPYQTPRMDDLRHMFREPRVNATPSLTGVRDMFVHGNVRAMETPTFEGVGQMMRTPDGYRYAAKDDEIEDLVEGEDVDVEDNLPKKINLVKTAATSHPVVTTKRRKTPRAEHIVEDEPMVTEGVATVAKGRGGQSSSRQAASEEGDKSIVAQKPKARLLRGQKTKKSKTVKAKGAKEDDSDEASDPTDSLASKSLKPPLETREGVDPAPPPAPRKVATRRVRQVTNDSDVLISEENPPQDEQPSKPTRKTRVTRSQSQTPAESESDVPVPATSKTTRKSRAKGTVQATVDQMTTGTSGARMKAVEVDGDDDPLDSIGSPEHEVRQEIDGVPTKVRRGTRSRTTTVESIKEEAEDTPLDTDIADEKARTGKGRKTAAKSSGGGTRTSARTRKGASPAPAVGVTSEDGFDKENAPDSIEEDEQVEKVTKVTRSKKATSVKAEKVLEAELVEAPARTRTARTRMRK